MLGSSETLHAPYSELVFSFELLDSVVWAGSCGKVWGTVCFCTTWARKLVWASSLPGPALLLAVLGGSSSPDHVWSCYVGALALGFETDQIKGPG